MKYTVVTEDDIDIIKSVNKRKRFWHLHLFRQLALLLPPVSAMFSAGMVFGTITVLMPQLKNNTELHLTKEQESWLYSSHGFVALPFLVTLPLLSEKYGRRPIYLATCIFITIGWVIQYFANSFAAYLIAEIFQAVNMAGNSVIGIIYISESSDPKYRGIFLVFKSASYIWGIWLANIIGTFTDSRNACILGFMSAIYSCIGLTLLPESPLWLADKGRYEDSKRSFFWFRGDAAKDYISEFNQMIAHQSKDIPKQKISNDSFSQKILRIYNIAISREFYMPFMISIMCFAMYQFCGKMVMSVYALVIVNEITNDMSLAYIIMLTVDAISVIGMYTGCYLVSKLKRRVMLFSTSFAGSFFMFIMSFLLFMSEADLFKVKPFVTVVLLVLYSFAVSLGPMSMTTSLFAEIVPMKQKPFTTGVAMITFFLLQSIFLKCNPYLMSVIGMKGLFLLYSTVSSLVLLFLYCFLPETKDKTLAEIESYFTSKKSNVTYLSRNDDIEMRIKLKIGND